MKLIVKNEDILLNYLLNNLDVSRKKVKEYLKHASIYVDGVKTTQFNYPLHVNSTIIIDTKNKVELPFPIVYEDNNIIVIDKPSNLLTIASIKEKEETAYHLVSEYLKKKNKYAKVFLVHRLDKDTSGLILFAKSERVRDAYQKDWNKIATRNYIAITHGKAKEKEKRLINFLKENKANLVYISKDGKESITNYKVIEETKKYSKLEINIETSRKNQIRVQLANINLPIVGDKKYGLNDKEKRLYLHANLLTIKNPLNNKTYTYQSKIPTEFKKILEKDK